MRLDEAVYPAAGGGVADVSLLRVPRVHRGEDLLVGFGVDLFTLALAGFLLDHRQHAGGLVGAHDGALGVGPGEGDELVKGPPAHGVVAGAVGAAEDDDDLGDDGVGHGVDHLGAGADDAALLGVAPDHEAGGVVEEDDGDLALVAIHDEAGGLVGGIVVDDAGHLGGGLGTGGAGGHLALDESFLVGDDAAGVATDGPVAADEGLPEVGFVLVEVRLRSAIVITGIHDAGDDVAHFILSARFVRED